MDRRRWRLGWWAAAGVTLLPAGLPAQAQSHDVRVHDPVMIEADGTYYLFHTGRGISVWASQDMTSWGPWT